MRKLLISLATVALSTGVAHAASGNSQTTPGTATAKVVTPLAISHSNGAQLSFGKFSVASTGTVVVATTGTGTPTGGVHFVNGSSTTADRFKVVGFPLRSFAVATGPGTVTAPGGASMSFTTKAAISLGILSVSGVYLLSVGGTLTVPAGQPGGTYSGTYPVVAYYN
ncbi:MAG: DUF4402 domain-containing protein [Sphingomonadales bacterium]|nr:DUF4402 domain-containing protein [Sphingomonadales bacterium]MDE2568434.1 DUF4402 domain-containing protein [Sphingomonadales bacterium]